MPLSRVLSFGGLAGWLLTTGCVGEIALPAAPGADKDQTGATGTGADGVTQFSCDANARTPTPGLRRLSRTQYENAVRDTLTVSVGSTLAAGVLERVAQQLRAVPEDTVTKEAAFARMDHTVSQQHVDTQFAAAQRIASELTSTSEGMNALLGDCAGASDGTAIDACVDAFVARFGGYAFRAPLSEADLTFYREVYASPGKLDARALSDVITVILTAPEFLYVVEGRGETSAEPGMVALTPYEKATRLALHFWQTIPDQALMARADAGDLSTSEGIAAVVSDLLDDPRSATTIQSFVREWFHLDALRPLDSLAGDPVYDAFVGDDIPSPDLRDDMIAELTESLAYHAFTNGDGLTEWVTSPYSFARSEELAAIYEVPTWDGTSEPPRFAEGERAGLLTRAALLATGTANTRPVMKGVFIRRNLLCDTIAPPPNNAAKNTPELSDNQTTREVVEALTEGEGSSCAGCHTTQINGLGFPSESFDGLGRARSAQRLFDGTGAVVAERPVDTQAIPRVWLQDERPVNNVAELTERVLESGKVEACFARQYVRFALGREEDVDLDGCTLEAVRTSVTEGKPIKDAFAAIALSPRFLERYVPETP